MLIFYLSGLSTDSQEMLKLLIIMFLIVGLHGAPQGDDFGTEQDDRDRTFRKLIIITSKCHVY